MNKLTTPNITFLSLLHGLELTPPEGLTITHIFILALLAQRIIKFVIARLASASWRSEPWQSCGTTTDWLGLLQTKCLNQVITSSQ